ncbi:MAG: cobaltochelatase subunit CobN [Planctomycetota bacterium]
MKSRINNTFRALPTSILVLILLLQTTVSAAGDVTLLVSRDNTYEVHKAVEGINLPDGIGVKFYTPEDIAEHPEEVDEQIARSGAVIVNVMIPDLRQHALEEINTDNLPVYAVLSSRNDRELEKAGIIFDERVQKYFSNATTQNVRNMIRYVADETLDQSVDYEEPRTFPDMGISHPESSRIFEEYAEYQRWALSNDVWQSGRPTLGVLIYEAALHTGKKEATTAYIKRLEAAGYNVLPCFGYPPDGPIKKYLTNEEGDSRVDALLSFALKMRSPIGGDLRRLIEKLDVPVFNAMDLYEDTIPQWRKSPVGIGGMEVMWNVANPEMCGLIEPTPLSGEVRMEAADSDRTFFKNDIIQDNLNFLIPRIARWIELREEENARKKVAILYYNHHQGKQNIGASYLNVFQSLEVILKRMREEGYRVESEGQLTETLLEELILDYGRNVGSWAPGELKEIVEQGNAVKLEMDTYKQWFQELPDEFRSKVTEQWGPVEDCDIMVEDGKFIIPAIRLKNVLIMPEPARGWGDDYMKLYHSPTLYPHHQYIAAYLWLKHVYDADAMVHLGTHATHEWLPGKQAGLSVSCPPEVLITDIPNLYPYIVDDVGEGIQAKRRGRGVVIDHLVPPLRKGELYREYSRLYELINDYNRAVERDSDTAEIKLQSIAKLATKTGIVRDLDIEKITEESLEKIEHYLLDLKSNFMPYGLHTFGNSPSGEPLVEMTDAITGANPNAEPDIVREKLIQSGQREIDNLMAGLDGHYIPAGGGNDPLRNLRAIPTGKNFYGFDPGRIPSKSAWALGKKAAKQIIAKKRREKGRIPNKVAMVLWATETVRNEGVNESTILYLLGLRPVWDEAGRVKGTRVIPGKKLGRPRIDVLINPSGLYRDMFPGMIKFLDDAVRKAMVQKDIRNLVRQNTRRQQKALESEGMDRKRAARMAKMRIFSEKPGSYGTGVSSVSGASSTWDDEEDIAGVYENRVGYAFGGEEWGQPAKKVLQENLSDVDVAVHSISSNVYGTMDNDDMFQYLGGLSLAVRARSGEGPDTIVTMQRDPNKVEVESATKTIGRELRTRYLNPKWIKGMKKENYAGAREMSNFVDYMWGWQVTVPQAVDDARWQQTYEVYVEDKYDLGMTEFFRAENPWSYQSINARMLEAVRKEYWDASEKVKQRLAAEYAKSVISEGVACCHHTCNNPLLNQMVVNILSIPGVMAPAEVARFKAAIEQATEQKLSQQAKNRMKEKARLSDTSQRDRKQSIPEETRKTERDQNTDQGQKGSKKKQEKTVEGYKMEEAEQSEESSSMSSSGITWAVSVFIAAVIGLFVYGARRRR